MRRVKNFLQRKKQKLMFYLYMAFLAAVSLSALLMPFGVKLTEKTMAVTYISGALFWIGLIGTIVMASFITYSRRRNRSFQHVYPHLKKWGIIHFFQNMPALFCDILMFISTIGFVITRIWLERTVWPFIFLSLFIFSFGMHCMLNGSNYIYVNYQTRSATKL